MLAEHQGQGVKAQPSVAVAVGEEVDVGGGVADSSVGVVDGTSVVGGISVVGGASVVGGRRVSDGVNEGVGVSSWMTTIVSEGVAEFNGVLVGTLGTLMIFPAWMKVELPRQFAR